MLTFRETGQTCSYGNFHLLITLKGIWSEMIRR